MAFYDENEDIKRLSLREMPTSVGDCFKPDTLSKMLWKWAQNIANWGWIIFFFLIVCGLFVTMATGISTYDELEYTSNGESLTILATLAVALQWGIYSFVEYCAYHVLLLWLGALASTVQSNRIVADLALYNAGRSIENTVTADQCTVDALGELARKKAQGLISDVEYAAKQREILKHL